MVKKHRNPKVAMQQALWFVGLWAGGVGSIAAFAYTLRWITQFAYGA